MKRSTNKILLFAFAALALSGCEDSVSPLPDRMEGRLPERSGRGDSLPVAVTEICSGNAGLEDPFGEDPGWVEITNISPDTVRLGGFKLRGEGDGGSAWRLPDSALPPGGGVLVFMSGRDIRETAPARRDAFLVPLSVSGWSDSLMDPNPGLSAVRPSRFGQELSGRMADGTIGIGARIVLKDNKDMGTGFSSANISAEFLPWDASNYDHLLIRGTFPANQELQIRLCDGSVCWQRGSMLLTGTGKAGDEYLLALREIDVNVARITGMQIDPPQDQIGTYDIDIERIGFRSLPRHAHASFKLKRKGGWLALEDSSGAATPRIEYPEMPATASWALDPATGRWNAVSSPSPNSRNLAEADAAMLESPVFLTVPGFLQGPATVRMAPGRTGVVRCETGGRLPTGSSPAVSDSGVRVDSTEVVSCAVFSDDGRSGPVATSTFFVGEKLHLPVVSLSVDPQAMFDPESGLYSKGPNASGDRPNFGANFWKNTELAGHVELFEPGVRGFGVPAGISIFGNWTRANRKKALSVQFREEYGASEIDWPLFPHHPRFRKFKGFALRANGSNSGSDYVRDCMMQSFMEARGIEYQLSRHVVLFINGKYWGIYEIREKMDSDYFRTRFGIDKSNVDLIKNNNIVQAGSATDWHQLRATAEYAKSDDSLEWAYISERIDLDNYMDYLAGELYSQNQDWPANNSRCWRRNGSSPSKWRMMMFDMDGGLGGFSGKASSNPFPHVADSALPWDAYPNGRGATVFARRIFQRRELRDRFVNRFLVQLSTNLSPRSTGRVFDSIQGVVEQEMPRDVERWGFDAGDIRLEKDSIRSFLDDRPARIRQHMRAFFKLDTLVRLDVSAQGGEIEVEGIGVGTSYQGEHFRSLPIRLRAVPKGSGTFAGWSDGVREQERTFLPSESGTSLVAKYE